MRILFTGGGTMGSVSPLLAQIDYLLSEHGFLPADFMWIGTATGPEKAVIERYDIKFKSIPAGKLRRYFSLRNFTDPFRISRGYLQSLEYIQKFKPDLVVTAGSFVSVPVIMAAKTLRKPVLVHQLDLIPGLANKIMAKVANVITVSWPELLNKFPQKNVKWVGTPIRKHILEPITGTLAPSLELDEDLPLILVMGGGTGAVAINRLIGNALQDLLSRYQVVHITGTGKKVNIDVNKEFKHRYWQFEFIHDDLGYLMHRADLIISRAGIGTISEILACNKPSIIIPIPDSHQEENAKYFNDQGAIKVVSQVGQSPKSLAQEIDNILLDAKAQETIMNNASLLVKKDANELLTQEIFKFK
ncbi:MAG: undecaprenyldiphospho-muramoylpentapeptide beta-N-acetylglucosaminyltransferase [Candidatus Komeilibacteria bacterium]